MFQLLINKITRLFRNFYFITSFFFFFWMMLMDSYNIWLQISLSNKHKKLLNKKQYYEDKILAVRNDKAALINNLDELERLAREKHLMKKDNEDVYIIQKEQSK